MVTLDELSQVPAATRDEVLIAAVNRTTAESHGISAGDDAFNALKDLSRSGTSVQPVLADDGRCVGLFHQEAVQQWLKLSQTRGA